MGFLEESKNFLSAENVFYQQLCRGLDNYLEGKRNSLLITVTRFDENLDELERPAETLQIACQQVKIQRIIWKLLDTEISHFHFRIAKAV